MKKLLSLVLVAVMLCTALVMSACGKLDDIGYVTERGKLVVGITEFAPMDYKDASGNWIGFDADLAKLFAEELGVTVEFVEIEWDNKALELQNRTIDCVWNGMTLTDEVLAAMSCSDPYCNNAQIVVISADRAASAQSVDACKSLTFAVEKGSAGAKAADANGLTKIEVADQATALMEVAAGTADAAIIDSLMAGAMIGAGTAYPNLTTTVRLTTEEYGIGFRKNSNLVKKLNNFMDGLRESGKLRELAVKYGVQEATILE